MSIKSQVSVVIPTFNEEESISSLLDEIISLSLFEEIIVVNDGSTDSTKEIVNNYPEIILINNKINSGNGASVKKGILRATKEYVVLLDADGQHPPQTIKRLLDHAIENEYDLVVASRKGNRNVSFFRMFGNRILEAFARYVAGVKVEDLTSGFRVFRRSSVMKIIHLFPQRYSYPTTSLLGLLALGYNVGYLQIPEIKSRQKGSSGISPFKDFFRFVAIMFRMAVVFAPAKVFLPLSFFLLVIGLTNIGLTLYFQSNIQELGLMMTLLSFVIAAFAILGEQIARIRIEIGTAVANEIAEKDK